MGMIWSYMTGSPLPTPIPRPAYINPIVTGSLYELYSNGEEPTVEVIFFHGLQLFDYREAFWTTWLSRDNTVVWPVEWLGPDLRNARILAVSYDSSARQSDAGGNVDLYQITENLIHDLVRDGRNCPKILVGHSLGGLIIKELLLKMNRQAGDLDPEDPMSREQQENLRRYVSNCRGIVYYGTPHGGSHLADYTNKIPLFKPNEPIIKLLRVLNSKTARINNDFSKIRRTAMLNVKTRSVAESRPTTLFKLSALVVPEGSSRMDVDDNYTEPNANHFEVCKAADKKSAIFTFLRELCVLRVPEARPEATLPPAE